MSQKKPKPVRKRLDPEVAARKVRALGTLPRGW
jgi:hypothetical protein